MYILGTVSHEDTTGDPVMKGKNILNVSVKEVTKRLLKTNSHHGAIKLFQN